MRIKHNRAFFTEKLSLIFLTPSSLEKCRNLKRVIVCFQDNSSDSN